MSLYVSSLNSGSNGNCYYVGTSTEAILVDVGISCREIEKRMKRLRLNLTSVKAIFITHEHSDHIKGLPGFLKKYPIPIYITNHTYTQLPFTLAHVPIHYIQAHQAVLVGCLSVLPFPKMHDAIDPCSFVIEFNQTKVGVFTDVGVPCSNVIKHFKQCHAAFLEANYDEAMLRNSMYPYFLKRRITGGEGHLSNAQALALFQQHRSKAMTHLFLSHLSKNNNCPLLARELFVPHASGVEVVVASRFCETDVYEISNTRGRQLLRLSKKPTAQLSFSFA